LPRPNVVLVAPDGSEQKIELSVDEEARRFSAEVPARLLAPTADKPYVLKIEAKMEGQEPLSSQFSFEVTYPELDRLDTDANLAILKEISEKTNGEHRRLNEFEHLLKQLRLAGRPTQKMHQHHEDLAASLRWPAVIAIIVLLCVEWAIRKRRGLV